MNEDKALKLTIGFLCGMVLALAFAPIFVPKAKADDYLKVGIGYKLDEFGIYEQGKIIDEPLSARIEYGYESGPLTFGVAHRSQWLRGWPVNDLEEYHVTEVFIDYKFDLW